MKISDSERPCEGENKGSDRVRETTMVASRDDVDMQVHGSDGS